MSVTVPQLFDLERDSAPITSDDAYTPRWVFDAMDLAFDLDVAAPPGGGPCVPAAEYFTPADDGLTRPWHGTVWCNPPFSNAHPWAARWAAHDRGALLGIMSATHRSRPAIFAAADAVAFASIDFLRPGRPSLHLMQACFVAFRGVGTGPAERIAAADRHGAVLYGRPQ